MSRGHPRQALELRLQRSRTEANARALEDAAAAVRRKLGDEPRVRELLDRLDAPLMREEDPAAAAQWLPASVEPWREDPVMIGSVPLPANPQLVPMVVESAEDLLAEGALRGPEPWRALARAQVAIRENKPERAELVEAAITHWRRPVFRLDDGTVAYGMARVDDCFRSAIATMLQVHVDAVPDGRTYRRLADGDDPDTIAREGWRIMIDWFHDRGLELCYHETPPIDRERWVGILQPPSATVTANDTLFGGQDRPFREHAVVCAYDRIIFDVTATVPRVPGHRPRRYRLSDIAAGLTFAPITEHHEEE